MGKPDYQYPLLQDYLALLNDEGMLVQVCEMFQQAGKNEEARSIREEIKFFRIRRKCLKAALRIENAICNEQTALLISHR